MGMVLTLSEAGADAMLYGDNSGILARYLQNQMQNMQPAFNEYAQRMYSALQQSYNYVTDQLVKYGIMNELQSQGLTALDSHYKILSSFDDIQSANFTMQRWVLAHPTVRQLYLDQNLDGYSDTYKNVFGKGVGDNDYNYRRVYDGVLQDVADGGWVVKTYHDELMPGDKPLDRFERNTILHTHDVIDWLLETSNWDFTHPGDNPVKINR